MLSENFEELCVIDSYIENILIDFCLEMKSRFYGSGAKVKYTLPWKK